MTSYDDQERFWNEEAGPRWVELEERLDSTQCGQAGLGEDDHLGSGRHQGLRSQRRGSGDSSWLSRMAPMYGSRKRDNACAADVRTRKGVVGSRKAVTSSGMES